MKNLAARDLPYDAHRMMHTEESPDELIKEVPEGKIEGERGPGRMHIGMIDDLLWKKQ